MKKLITVSLLSLLAFGSLALAQGGPGQHFFEELDKNHDGKLTRSEAQADAKERFAQIDANHDGKATKEELKAHHEAKMAEHHKKMAETGPSETPTEGHKGMREHRGERFFARMDANQDGVLDESEFATGLTRRFDFADQNHDEVVDAAELREGFHRGGHCDGQHGDHAGKPQAHGNRG